MPNWCSTSIEIDGNVKEIESLYNAIEDALNTEKYSDVSWRNWIGYLLIHLGYKYEDVDSWDIRCMGNISYVQNGISCIYIHTETARAPMIKVFLKMMDKYAPTAHLFYTSEEPVVGLFCTNDPGYVGNYVIDFWGHDCPNADLKWYFDEGVDYVEPQDLYNTLKEILKPDEKRDLSELIEVFLDRYGDYVSINQFQYLNERELD